MGTARRLAWPVLMVAALVTDVAMAWDFSPGKLFEGNNAAPSVAPNKQAEGLETLRGWYKEQCLSLVRDIENVERMNTLLRQKELLLETGATPAPVPPAGASSMSSMAAGCDSPSADLLAKLTDQDNAERKLNVLLAQKVALLEKQAGTARK